MIWALEVDRAQSALLSARARRPARQISFGSPLRKTGGFGLRRTARFLETVLVLKSPSASPEWRGSRRSGMTRRDKEYSLRAAGQSGRRSRQTPPPLPHSDGDRGALAIARPSRSHPLSWLQYGRPLVFL